MNKPEVKHLIIFCSIIFVILASITVFVLENDRKFNDFYLGIYEVDNNINSGYLIPAGEKLAGLFNKIFNPKTALIFLKRAEMIASSTDDYGNFADYSERIYKKYDSNIEIAAVCAYALRMDMENQKALSISEAELKNSVYNKIHLLNLLENKAIIEDLKIIEDFKDQYGFLFSEDYEPGIFADAGKRSGDQRYLIDEALLLLEKGELKAADKILAEIHDDSYYELKMLTSFDNLDYSRALNYFYQLQSTGTALADDIFFAGCDILMKNGKKEEVSDLYAAYIEEQPAAHSLPYRNLFSLNRKQGSSVKWLAQGLDYFPESTELLIPAAWVMYLNNDDGFSNTLNRMESSGDNTIAELFKINAMPAGRNPEHVIGNYWNVFNSDPQSKAVAISFANYLLQNRQYDQLAFLLQKYQMYNRPEEWVHQYSAIGHAVSGNPAQALTDIEAAVSLSQNYINTYNKAVILDLSGYTADAVKSCLQALQQAESEEEINSNNLSKIYFKLAETNYNMNSFRDAYHYIRMAIDLDSDNMKNKLLLRKIKEEYND